eukprot:gene6507-8945_t
MISPEWLPLVREYDGEKSQHSCTLTETSTHPLQPRSKQISSISPKSSDTNTKNSQSKAKNVSDPLSVMLDPLLNNSIDDADATSKVIDDPLTSNFITKYSQIESRNQNIEIVRQAAQEIHEEKLNTPWQIKKLQILKEYSVTGSIAFSSSAINEFSGSGVEDGSQTRHLDKYNQRLASLERRNISHEKVELTQKEYEAHVDKLSSDLNRAWANDERVNSLKIAIQLAKLLADTTVPQFYPAMFVMVTNVLDRFGEMVYNRLKSKAEEALNDEATSNTISSANRGTKKLKLPEDFACNDVPISARETCRNWFYKTACIRELLPRFYIEVALFKCFRFLTESSTDFGPILSRLASIIRGIGDPLVAQYARTYLIVMGNEVVPSLTNHAILLLQDTLYAFPMLRDPFMLGEYEKWKITQKNYIFLLSPACEWILKCVGRSANREVFQSILALYREHSNDTMILKHIIDSFDATHYNHASLGMFTLIKDANQSCYTTVDLFTSLGKQLSIYPPPEDQRLPLLNEVWKIVLKSTDMLPYVRCCYAWLDVIQKYYSEREMMILLSNLSIRLTTTLGGSDPTSYLTQQPVLSEAVMQQLEALVKSLIGQSSTFGTAVLTSEHLLKILDSFKGSKKVSLCKDILESFRSQKPTNDAVLINSIFDLGRNVHDSVDCLSPQEERIYISILLNSFIDKIDFGHDFEQQLNFYVECRAVFCNLDMVKDKLICCVNNLTMKTMKLIKGKHNKKTSSFVKGCFAYCHITIPSLNDNFRKLELLFLCAQSSLVNQCLPQTDTFLKAAISLIPELATSSNNTLSSNPTEITTSTLLKEEKLCNYLLSLISFLVLTPGHPEYGPFYIAYGLLNAVPKYPWIGTNNTNNANNGIISSSTSGSMSTSISGGVSVNYLLKIYIHMIALLCTYAQKKFPYRLQGIESNDVLYGRTIDYMKELNQQIQFTMDEILKLLLVINERVTSPSATNGDRICLIKYVLEFINQLSYRMAMTNSLLEFIVKLFELIYRIKNVFTKADLKYFTVTVEYVLLKYQQTASNPLIQANNNNNYNNAITAINTLKSFLK